MGFELEVAGSKTRPILRLRIDREGAEPRHGVCLADCTRVSREVESFLDERPDLSERYVLEVSSPGRKRPLIKRSAYQRFAGQEVAIRTSEAIADKGKRFEGVLRGIADDDVVTVEVSGEPVAIALGNIKKAHLVFKWNGKSKEA